MGRKIKAEGAVQTQAFEGAMGDGQAIFQLQISPEIKRTGRGCKVYGPGSLGRCAQMV